MKAEEIKKHYTIDIIDRNDNKWRVMEVEDDVEMYANQRVIEELEGVLSDLEGICDGSIIEAVEERIKELKQE